MMTAIIVAIVLASMAGNWGGNRRNRGRLSREAEDRIAALEADLANRDEALTGLENRVLELESRLDFTERLLAAHGTDSKPQDLAHRA